MLVNTVQPNPTTAPWVTKDFCEGCRCHGGARNLVDLCCIESAGNGTLVCQGS